MFLSSMSYLAALTKLQNTGLGWAPISTSRNKRLVVEKQLKRSSRKTENRAVGKTMWWPMSKSSSRTIY